MAQVISALAGMLLSLALSYLPGASDWWEKRTGTEKRLGMLAFTALAALLAYGVGCSGLTIEGIPAVSCDQAGALTLAQAFFAAVVASQTTYILTNK